MCLESEFFDAREALIRQREAVGDIELEHFLKPRHVSIDRLYRFGILKNDRDYFTTADLFVHEITDEGARFMEADEDYQLIFVRRDDAPAFGTFLNRAKRTKMDRTI
jgi:hypothetical protein